MNKNMWKQRIICLSLLVMVFALTGCKKEKVQENQESSNPEVVVDNDSTEDKGSTVVEGGNTAGEMKVYPEGSVTFGTEHSYSKLLKLTVSLPDGVKAADITDLLFQIDTEMPLELRLYAGAKDVQKTASSEVSTGKTEAVSVLKSSDKTTVDGVEVDNENYDITLEAKDSTRVYLVEGDGQKVSFGIEGSGKEYLGSIEGDAVVFGLYANNVAPKYTIYSLSFQANGQSYELNLDESSVKASQGSYLLFH